MKMPIAISASRHYKKITTIVIVTNKGDVTGLTDVTGSADSETENDKLNRAIRVPVGQPSRKRSPPGVTPAPSAGGR